jgi:hypothetical protein
MAELSINDAVEQVLAVLREAFEGAQQWSYFTDHGADAGLLGTLDKLSAADASRPAGGTTVAAHAHHTAFGLEAVAAWVRGDRTPSDWPQSWRVSAVGDAAWARLRQELRTNYDELRRAIQEYAATSVEALGGAVGAVAHVAYHLGAIKQKVAHLRQP